MAIPESQFEAWSRQGAITTSRITHETIYNALIADSSPIRDMVLRDEVKFYLQGSYKNDTNVRGDSDVDLVVELTSTFVSNLTTEEMRALGFSTATYTWQNFRADVVHALRTYFGSTAIDPHGNKSVKVLRSSNRLSADVVVCLTYHQYSNLRLITSGIVFWAQRDGSRIVNFPIQHYEHGVIKNRETDGWFKSTVRMLKNARTYLVDSEALDKKVAPSYFLECLIYNAPDALFGESYRQTFCQVVGWLAEGNPNNFVCQNEQHLLCGVTPEQWSPDMPGRLIEAFIHLWNDWH